MKEGKKYKRQIREALAAIRRAEYRHASVKPSAIAEAEDILVRVLSGEEPKKPHVSTFVPSQTIHRSGGGHGSKR